MKEIFIKLFTDANNKSSITLLTLLWRSLGYHEIYRREIINTLADFEMLLNLMALNKPEGKTAEEMENTLLRLRLILYAHFVELSSIYDLVFIIYEITTGKIDVHPEKNEIAVYPIPYATSNDKTSTKVEALRKAMLIDYPKISGALDTFYDNRLRNGIFHSKYSFEEDSIKYEHNHHEFEITRDEFIKMFIKAMEFFGDFLSVYEEYKYKLATGGPIKDGALTLTPIFDGKSLQLQFTG